MYSMIVNRIFYQNPIILSILRSYRKALSTDLFHRFAVPFPRFSFFYQNGQSMPMLPDTS